MKLSQNTINVLKNFSSINPSIIIKPGNSLATMSPNKTIMAKANVTEAFTGTYGIYALNRFISVLSLFDDPELQFDTETITVGSEGKKTTYYLSDTSVLLAVPDREIKLPSVDVEVKLTNKDLQSVMKALGVLGLSELAVVGDGAEVSLQAVDTSNKTKDAYSIRIGTTDKVFKAVFRSENLKIMDGDYDLKISSRGISQFVGTDVTYWIAVEAASSTF
jgi:hypothetical protein